MAKQHPNRLKTIHCTQASSQSAVDFILLCGQRHVYSATFSTPATTKPAGRVASVGRFSVQRLGSLDALSVPRGTATSSITLQLASCPGSQVRTDRSEPPRELRGSPTAHRTPHALDNTPGAAGPGPHHGLHALRVAPRHPRRLLRGAHTHGLGELVVRAVRLAAAQAACES